MVDFSPFLNILVLSSNAFMEVVNKDNERQDITYTIHKV